jgi:hypothetical protein
MSPPATRRTVLRRCGIDFAIGLAGYLESDRSGSSPAGSPTGTRSTDTTKPTTADTTDTENGSGSTPRDDESPVLWHADLGSAVGGSPSASHDAVSVGTEAGTVQTFATVGRRRWTFEADTRLTDLLCGSERAFVGSENGVLYAPGDR